MSENTRIFFDNVVPRTLHPKKNKKIILQDESQLISNELIRGKIKNSKTKLFFTMVILLSVTLYSVYRALMYSTQEQTTFEVTRYEKQNRGLIYDRNKNIISASIPAKDLFINPKKLLNPKMSKEKLKKIFPERNFSQFDTLKSYRLIKKYISRSEEIEIKKIGEPGFVIESTTRRVYPQNNLFSNVTGFLSKHGKAQSKIEKNFDKFLSEGNDLNLTLDLKIQNIVHEELSYGMKSFNSKSAASIVINVNNGEVLSLVSLPDYNPNYPSMIGPYAENNLITSARYEMGSTLKTFTVASAINAKVNINDTFFDVTNPYFISKNEIKDIIKFEKPQNISNIFINSSNIGSIKLFDYLGLDWQKSFFELVGLKDETRIHGLKSIKNKFPKIWDQNSGRSLSFGYGASITPISLVRSFSTLVNGGYKINLSLIKNEIIQKEKIIDLSVSQEINKLLHSVVELGTGRYAKVEKLEIGGKTGTTRKIKDGKYSNDVITSFIGIFPIDNPQYLVFVLFDEPNSKNTNHNFYGGNTAAPVFSKIVSRIYPILEHEKITAYNLSSEK
tara:strand:+ start:5557 stop:7233 length:1677 start_codon:yes stop_codon:yes gene_type:complete